MTDKIPQQTLIAWESYPSVLTKRLIQLRKLILDAASNNPAIGPLEETLKWGEPAFLTSETGSGTTVRINRYKTCDDKYALYVPCQTDLIERYKQLYDDELDFDGNRAVMFDVADVMPTKAVSHCVEMALTYHLPSHF